MMTHVNFMNNFHTLKNTQRLSLKYTFLGNIIQTYIFLKKLESI